MRVIELFIDFRIIIMSDNEASAKIGTNKPTHYIPPPYVIHFLYHISYMVNY